MPAPIASMTLRRQLLQLALTACAIGASVMLMGGCETRQIGEARYYFVDPDYGISPALMKNSQRVAPTGLMPGYDPQLTPHHIESSRNP